MISFIGGPADGETLFIRRSPVFLRVVIAPDGSVDALDRLEDDPEPGEGIHVYRRREKPSVCHIRFGGKSKTASGWYPVATYYHSEDQPEDDADRDREEWRAWVLDQLKGKGGSDASENGS